MQHEIPEIEDGDVPHLDNIIHGGLMKTVTPEHVEIDLVKRGHILRVTGGLIATEMGHKSFMQWHKKGK